MCVDRAELWRYRVARSAELGFCGTDCLGCTDVQVKGTAL